MSIFKGKSWADLAYQESDDETTEQTQQELPSYYRRVISSVEQHQGKIVELVVRDFPEGVSAEDLRKALPIVECSITPELVRVFMRKEDVIVHIKTKRLKETVRNTSVSLCVQRPSEEVKALEEKHTKVQTQPKTTGHFSQKQRRYLKQDD